MPTKTKKRDETKKSTLVSGTSEVRASLPVLDLRAVLLRQPRARRRVAAGADLAVVAEVGFSKQKLERGSHHVSV